MWLLPDKQVAHSSASSGQPSDSDCQKGDTRYRYFDEFTDSPCELSCFLLVVIVFLWRCCPLIFAVCPTVALTMLAGSR